MTVKVKLPQFLLDEQYSYIGLPKDNKQEVFVKLEELHTNNQLFTMLKIKPTRLEYYPLDEQPHIICSETNLSPKILLYR